MNSSISDQKIRIGMISYAHTAHAVSYSTALANLEGAELAAIYDEDEPRGQSYAAQFRVPFYPAVEDLLARPDLQAVIVCSPTNRHRELVCAAAQAGKHVLCEKPIATTSSDAQAMIAACRKAGVLLQIPFVCRFIPVVQTARQLIQDGEFGRALGVIGGNRGRPPLPPTYPEWIIDPIQAGGGALLDHSVHVTDAIRFIFDSEVESVFAHQGVFGEQALPVEDCALLSLQFQNGMIATVDPSWSNPANNPAHYDFYLRILGEKGTLNLDETRQSLLVVSDRPGQRGVAAQPFGQDADEAMVRHFVQCARLGKNLFPAATGEDGLRALEIALAAYASIHSRQPVQVTLERNFE